MQASRHRRLLGGCLPLALLCACPDTPESRQSDPVLVDLSLFSVAPDTWIPGTAVTATGAAFVDDPWGESRLRLRGSVSNISGQGSTEVVNIVVPLAFGDFDRLTGTVDADTIDALGGTDARFDGTATVEVVSAVDSATYASAPLDVRVFVNELLAPQLTSLTNSGIIFPNEPIMLEAADLLLPGEGETVAVVEGCFAAAGAEACDPVGPVEVGVIVADDRNGGHFAFEPIIAGIEPGHFEGSVSLRNKHVSGNVTPSATLPVQYDLTEPIIYGVSTTEATLGQFIDVQGGGFVGDGQGDTLLSYVGTYTPQAGGPPREFDVVLLPEFVDGVHVRYVVSETDAIGQFLDVRYEPGVFDGVVTPMIAYGDQEVMGDPVPLVFTLRPVKQVVQIEFLPSYTESLRHFGLRAVDQQIRERVFAVLQRDYATLNVEFRDTTPADYALFARVDVGGPDLNQKGLLGYDNTPGKDTENERLYDRIGGVNALTQEDGYPGYGGVFIESLLGYSTDPAGYADVIAPVEAFDDIFDPFRIERGGTAVASADLAGGIPVLTSGGGCPVSDDRRLQVACAVWALGNMVGSTVAHEIGHSLGLADPYGAAFHNAGDEDNRLMDADRPFAERAQLDGQGPSVFCAEEYQYLRAVLPTDDPEDTTVRPPCY